MKSVDAFVASLNESSSSRLPQLQQIAFNSQYSQTTTTTSLMAEKRSGNPFQSFLGDAVSSIVSNVGGNGGNGNSDEVDKKLNEINALSSWDDIRTILESKQTKDEKTFRSNVEKGIGRASPLNKIRLYDESNKEEDIRVTLYRDHASWCPCKCLRFGRNYYSYLKFV